MEARAFCFRKQDLDGAEKGLFGFLSGPSLLVSLLFF